MSYVPPDFDEELAAALPALHQYLPATVTPDHIRPMRQAPLDPGFHLLVAESKAQRSDFRFASYDGAELEMSVFSPLDEEARTGAAIYHTHGGGMVFGNRFKGVESFLHLVSSHGATIVTVEYRLAPEFPDPTPIEDCYAGLLWTVDNANNLGIDPSQIVVAGMSAGGGLAAGVVLLARDRKGPQLLGQLLMCPMLDDRNETISSRQFDGIGIWDRGSNEMGWRALLGKRRGTDDVSAYAAPGRETNLSGLPPAYIDVGSAEVFRDEDVAYAMRIWACGGSAELHVWPGGFHGYEQLVPEARISEESRAARNRWIDKMLTVKVPRK